MSLPTAPSYNIFLVITSGAIGYHLMEAFGDSPGTGLVIFTVIFALGVFDGRVNLHYAGSNPEVMMKSWGESIVFVVGGAFIGILVAEGCTKGLSALTWSDVGAALLVSTLVGGSLFALAEALVLGSPRPQPHS